MGSASWPETKTAGANAAKPPSRTDGGKLRGRIGYLSAVRMGVWLPQMRATTTSRALKIFQSNNHFTRFIGPCARHPNAVAVVIESEVQESHD